MRDRPDFAAINQVALTQLPKLLRQWLPNGGIVGNEYVALNPTRNDRRPGSFKINIKNGLWADFATGDSGSNAVSLFAYLAGTGRADAASILARMLGVEARDGQS